MWFSRSRSRRRVKVTARQHEEKRRVKGGEEEGPVGGIAGGTRGKEKREEEEEKRAMRVEGSAGTGRAETCCVRRRDREGGGESRDCHLITEQLFGV